MIGRIVLYGVGSPYTAEVEEICHRLGIAIAAYIANREGPAHVSADAPIIKPDEINDALRNLPAAIPLLTPGYRKAIRAELEALGMISRPILTDPSVVIARTARLAEGTIVNALCAIGAKTQIGAFAAINRGATIGHDGRIGDYVSLGPAATVCGQVAIGDGTFIGAGAVVAPEVMVGRNCIIAAGSVVRKDVPDNCLVAGNPGRIAKRGIRGYNGSGV